MFDQDVIHQSVTKTTVTFKTTDGAELVGCLFRPDTRPLAAVVLNSATGVPQHYYAHFARWLVEARGMACLTYDYRDSGRSWSGPLRASTADMSDWGIRDQVAARRAMARAVPDAPLWVIGHSLGAMLLPNQPETDSIARVIGVASGIVHHSDHPWPYRALAMNFWFTIGPLATALCGYLPGNRLGFGEDLPSGVFWQWRRWCTSRGFNEADFGPRLPAPNWTGHAPVRLHAFTDDDLVPTRCVERLACNYAGAAEVVKIDPKDFGLDAIGHLSAFSRRNRTLWPVLLEA